MKRIIETIFATTLLIAAGSAVGQPASHADMLASPPELMVIEKIDRTTGVVVIDGQEFELYDGDTSLLGLPPEAAQRRASLDQLSAGTEVMVSTDGIETTARRRSKIIAIWWPR